MVGVSSRAGGVDSITIRLLGRKGDWDPAIHSFVHLRLGRAVGRLSKRIRAIMVWLEDINGPKGGVDKSCRIEVKLVRRGRIAVTGRGTNAYAAITRAAERTRRAVARRISKHRAKRQATTRVDREGLDQRGLMVNMQHSCIESLVAGTPSPGAKPLAVGQQPIGIGSTVAIRDLQSGERDVYTVVHPHVADITRGYVSSMTPAGQALFGRVAGETVEISAPGGIVRVIVESVGMCSTK